MTTPTLHDQTGIAVLVNQPVWKGDTGSFSITRELSGFTCTKNALGGFGNASIQVTASLNTLYDWFADGIGRDILVVDGDGLVVYNGFANKITINTGGLAVTRGPLSSLANRVSCMYVPILDETVDPPVLGDRTENEIAEDATSQAKYGIVEKVLSIGNALDEDADSVRDLYLDEHREPEVSQQISFGGGELSLTIECAGYYEMFDLFVYNNTATPMSVELTTKILAILTAEQAVNAIFSTNTSHIGWNAVLTSSYEAENRTAGAILKAMLAHGGGSDERWILGVYEDRVVHYDAMPTTIEYQLRIHGRSQVVRRLDNTTVHPWAVMPGKWLFMPDLLPGYAKDPTDLKADPRAMFIESVTYTAPYGLSVSGGKVETLSQRMSKLGLGGIG